MKLEEKPKRISVNELCKNDVAWATATLYEYNLQDLTTRRIHDLAGKILDPVNKQEALLYFARWLVE